MIAKVGGKIPEPDFVAPGPVGDWRHYSVRRGLVADPDLRSIPLQRRRIQQRQRTERICRWFAAFDAGGEFRKLATDVVPVAILHTSEQAMAERELEIRFDGERFGIAGNGHGV